MAHRTMADLEAGLATVRAAPREAGTVVLIVRRPAEREREILHEGRLELGAGLVGDSWSTRTTTPNPEAEVTIMGSRAAALVAGSEAHEDWTPAGDQFYVDLDLSTEHLPTGTRLRLGAAVVEVTAEPHLGCGKFARRFGVDALKLVNREDGRALRVRGVNVRVVEPGVVRPGDAIAVVGA